MKKFTASRKVEWLQTPGSLKRHCHVYGNTATYTELEESDPFADVEEDEDELEENELVVEDC